MPDIPKNITDFIKDNDLQPVDFGKINPNRTGFSGTVISSGRIKKDEWVADLYGVNLYQIVRKMRTDATIGAIETSVFNAIIGAKTQIDYPVEHQDSLTDADHEILDFVRDNFEHLNLREMLHNALLFKPYGFSLQAIYWNLLGDALVTPNWNLPYTVRIDKLGLRRHETIIQWLLNSQGEFAGVNQLVYSLKDFSYQWKTITKENLLLITNRREGDNFEGQSEYRRLYRDWLLIQTAAESVGIAIDRFASGIPVVRLNANATDTKTYEDQLANMQASEKSYGVFKNVDEIKILTTDPNSLNSLRDFVDNREKRLAISMLMTILNLGTSASGNRSLGESFQDLWFNYLDGMSAEICEAVNQQLIEALVKYNFGERKVYPKFQIVLEPEMSTIVTMLTQLKTAGIIAGNQDIENWVLENYGLPLTNDKNILEWVTKGNQETVKPEQQPQPVAASDKPCNHTLAEHKAPEKAFSLELKLHRKPTDREKSICNLSQTVSALNRIKSDVATALKAVTEKVAPKYIEDLIASQGKFYKAKLQPGSFYNTTIKDGLARVAAQARGDVMKELQKQSKKVKFNQDRTDMTAMDEFANYLSQKYEINLQGKILDYYMQAAQSYRNNLQKLIEEQRAGYERQTGIVSSFESDVLASVLDMILSEKGDDYDRIASDMVGTYGTFREITAEEMAAMVDVKIRSEIMDDNTCEYCQGMDQREYKKFPDGTWQDEDGNLAIDLPDPNCAGAPFGNSCRGIYIYTVKEGAE